MSGSSAYPLGTEHTPNWLPGYVPSAPEWNMWWSNKVDFDDTRITGGPFLPLSGGTMLGAITLAGPPANPLEPATKAYVDAITPAAGPFLSQSGGTMTGTLILAGNPVGPLDATPRQYVDAIGSTANNALTVARAAVPITGATMTGPLTLSGNPTLPLGAATKQYVDMFLPLTGGNVTGPIISSSSLQANNLYSAGTMFMNAFNNWEWSFQVDTNGSKYQFFRVNWYDVWDGTNGTRSWVMPSGANMWLDGSGNLNVGGQVNAASFNTGGHGQFGSVDVSGGLNANSLGANYVSSNGNINANGTYTGGAFSVNSTSHVGGDLSVSGNFSCNNAVTAALTTNADIYCGSYGVVYTSYATDRVFAFKDMLNGYIYCYENGGAVGSLVPASSSVVKEGIMSSGFDCLSAVLRTPLYAYRYTGSGVTKPVGFIAEDQQKVFPESVLLEEDKPFGIDLMTAVAALFGAVQQLAHMISPATKV